MTRREFFGLRFYKTPDPIDGRIRSICTRDVVHVYSYLTFITHMDNVETQSLLNEIDKAINGQPYDVDYVSDNTGASSIHLAPPNIIIDSTCSVSLQDMKGLLTEWLAFINS